MAFNKIMPNSIASYWKIGNWFSSNENSFNIVFYGYLNQENRLSGSLPIEQKIIEVESNILGTEINKNTVKTNLYNYAKTTSEWLDATDC